LKNKEECIIESFMKSNEFVIIHIIMGCSVMSISILSQEDGIEQICRLAAENKLVPIFGSGFTMGCKANKSKVPNGTEATELMKKVILDYCNELKPEDLEKSEFNEVSEYFYDLVPKDVKSTFFRDLFTEVEISGHKKELLEFPWPYAYTLNIDDGIERSQCFKAVLPYKNLNRPDSSIKLLYKLHGDAFTEVTYKTDENIVFSHKQYLLSITSEQNTDLLNNLIADYSQKNLIYIGCSLKNEPDIKYVFGKIDENANNNYRILLRSSIPSFKEKMDLKAYGINEIILIEDYDLFYKELVRTLQNSRIEDSVQNYKYKNPVISKENSKESTIAYFSGSRIFDEEKNTFYKGGMHVLRNCVNKVEDLLNNHSCVVIKGRRFSGKTYLLSSLCERQLKYTIYFFPSTSLADEQLLFNMLQNNNNSLFIFDSNSLSASCYRLISNSFTLLKSNNNKIITVANSNDNFIVESLNSGFIELSSMFYGKELTRINELADGYGLIVRKKKFSNLDYLHKLSKEQKIDMSLLKYPEKLSKNEKIILILLSVLDKVFLGDAIALGISTIDVRDFLHRFPIIVEEMPVEVYEASTHSSRKIVHNSKIVLLSVIRALSNEEVIECINLIVGKFNNSNDKHRYRIHIEVILFDTLNQLFGGKKGAGNLIFQVYESLEEKLSGNLHYWLQRAKSIYRLLPNSYMDLKEAYRYAKKAYVDGNDNIRSKASLTTSLICCLLHNLEPDKDAKTGYTIEAIELAYEAIFSDYYKFNNRFLSNELGGGRKRMNSYELITNVCNAYLKEFPKGSLLGIAGKILDELDKLKKDYNAFNVR
jgi:hypothetical protein